MGGCPPATGLRSVDHPNPRHERYGSDPTHAASRPVTASSTPLRTAVVGVGYLGRFHAQKYAAHPECDLVAVVDPDEARRHEVATEVGAEALAAHADLLGRVDAVSIVSPTRSHHAVARDLLEGGIHVLVEKPITVTADEARELVAIA